MSKNTNEQTPPQLLRTAAEAKLRLVPTTQISAPPTDDLLHELRVHQIELEMQNDELRRAQNSIEESRDRYIALYDFAPVGYLTLTPKALISEINLTGATLLGNDRRKLIHLRFASLVSPEDTDRWRQHFMHTLQHEDKQSCELVLQRGDGSKFHALLDCLRLKNEFDLPMVSITLTDISERWQAEEVLRLNNAAELKMLLNSVAEGIYGVDMQGNCTFTNPSALHLLGYQHETDLLGKHMHELIHHTRADGSTYPAADCRLYHCLHSYEDIHVDDELFWRKDGSSFFVDYWSRPVRRDGEVVGAVITFFDITERKRAEIQLLESEELAKSAIEELHYQKFALDQHSIVATTDAHGTITYVNDKFCAISQYSREELLGQNHRMINSGTHPKEFFRDMYRTISAGKVWHGDCCNRAKDGSLYWVATTVVPYLENDGKPFQYIAIRTDITDRKKAEEKLILNKIIIDTTGEGFWLLDLNLHILEVNQAYAKMIGYTHEELVGMHISSVSLTANNPEWVMANIQKIISQGYAHFETQHRHKDGHIVDLEVSVTHIEKAKSLFSFLRDITERKRAEAELRIAAATFETHEAILITDANANIIRVNQAFQDITGYSPKDVLGKSPRILSSGQQDQTFYEEMWQQLLHIGAWAGEMWDRHKDGHIYPKYMTITAVKNAAGETTQYVAIFSDISVRKQAEEEIRNLAFYDPLTKLPNRRLLMDRLLQALAASARNEQHGAVMFLDMDHFKTLNDTKGHDVGDFLLIEVAKRLLSCVRDVDTVARLGGDEFVVLLETLGSTDTEASTAAELVVEKIRAALNQPYQFHEYEYRTTASIGVSMFYGHQQSVDELLKCADRAMYHAKMVGREAVRS